MKRFGQLYERLDATTSTNRKVEALVAYLRAAPPADAAWALYFLTGRRLKRFVSAAELAACTLAETGLPAWLLEESHAAVGDGAETIALLVDDGARRSADVSLASWMERLLPMRELDTEGRQRAVREAWSDVSGLELFLLNKLLTGAFRVGVSATLVERAVADVAGVPPATIAHRMMGTWSPDAAFVEGLLSPEEQRTDLASHPYPFYLASPLEGPVEELGDVADWQTEWKWDGIRAQLLRRGDEVYLWSRGEELITARFPEIERAARSLPEGTALDGEVLAFQGDAPLPFAALQRRIGRLVLSPKVLAEAPVVYMAYDLLEAGGDDLRGRPLSERRSRLSALLAEAPPVFRVSPELHASSWSELAALRESSRERGVEGLMLKRREAPYATGRRRGDFWKWKIQPHTADAVLVYAHPGSGRRASLFTDYTFAVWKDGELVPIAKAYSGLSDEEIAELDRWIRQHTLEKAGPVRIVEPSQVFELAFEGIALSRRHKAGVAVRFPRILRRRTDKRAEDADSVETLRALLPGG